MFMHRMPTMQGLCSKMVTHISVVLPEREQSFIEPDLCVLATMAVTDDGQDQGQG